MSIPVPANRSCLRIIVLGYIVRGPIGGLAWHHLQYVLGLAGLGHEVYFLEDSDDYPSCYDPVRNVVDTDPRYGLIFATRIFKRVGAGDKWAYYDAHTSTWSGPRAMDMENLCKSADLLLNLSAVNPLRSWTRAISTRVLIDTDPVFTQIRHLQDPQARALAEQHTHFFTFGENFGADTCTVPDDGYPWKPTRQPIVLDAWPVTTGAPNGHFTTVMQWDSYQVRKYDGVEYGMKSASFEPFLDLPQRTSQLLELALGSESAPRDDLRARGWLISDPLKAAPDPWAYQEYIRQSKAEFSVAKHGYVISHSGWFSERSAAYLASGRPVVVQETGFSDWIDTGLGVIAFSNEEEALAGIDDINTRYELHCEMARALALSHFDSSLVLSRLVEQAMTTPAFTVTTRTGR